jgi:hypothetical protein
MATGTSQLKTAAVLLAFLSLTMDIRLVEAVDPIQMCPTHLGTLLKRIGSCDSVKCMSFLTERQCLDMGAAYEEGAELCGCCPGCVKYEKGITSFNSI